MAKPSHSLSPPKLDVLIQCALNTEAISVMQILTQTRETNFDKITLLGDDSIYTHTVKDKFDSPLHVGVCWQAKEGPVTTSQFTGRVLEALKHKNSLPRYWLMAGICAGAHDSTKLGDVIVVKLAVEIGGALKTADVRPEVNPAHPTETALRNALGMVNETKWYEHLLTSWIGWPETQVKPPTLPPSMNECVRQLLGKLLTENRTLAPGEQRTGEQRKALGKILDEAPWGRIKREVTNQAIDRCLITKDLVLTEVGHKAAEKNEQDAEIFGGAPEARSPQVIVATNLSSPFVHRNLTDEELKKVRETTGQRKLESVEMEIHAFYHALHSGGFGGQYLAVKSVCDYGDQFKEDSFHSIAGEASAAFLRDFIRQHVTSEVCLTQVATTADQPLGDLLSQLVNREPIRVVTQAAAEVAEEIKKKAKNSLFGGLLGTFGAASSHQLGSVSDDSDEAAPEGAPEAAPEAAYHLQRFRTVEEAMQQFKGWTVLAKPNPIYYHYAVAIETNPNRLHAVIQIGDLVHYSWSISNKKSLANLDELLRIPEDSDTLTLDRVAIRAEIIAAIKECHSKRS